MMADDDWDWLRELEVNWKQRLLGILIVLLIAALAGCATWVHPTKGEAGFERDLYECEVQAAPIQDPWRVRQVKEQCMRLKGWKQA